MPRECSRTRIVVSVVAGLLSLALAGLWGFSQWYSIEVRKSSGTIWIERGCLAVEYAKLIAMAWSPSDALAKAMDERNPKIRVAVRPLQDRSVRFVSEWDPTDEVVHGFILPRFSRHSGVADFELMVGWDRFHAVLPLWVPVLLMTVLIMAIKPSRRAPRCAPTEARVENGDAIAAGPTIRRATLIYALASCLELFAASVCGYAIGSYLRSPPGEEDVASRAKRLERILNEPEVNSAELPQPEVKGPPDFQKPILDALALLKEKDPRGYELVCHYVSRISQGEATHAYSYEAPPRIELDMDTVTGPVRDCAEAVVHEACHCKIYQKGAQRGLPLREPDWRTANELVCIREQIRTAKLLGAQGWEISYLESLDGTHWKQARCVPDWLK